MLNLSWLLDSISAYRLLPTARYSVGGAAPSMAGGSEHPRGRSDSTTGEAGGAGDGGREEKAMRSAV